MTTSEASSHRHHRVLCMLVFFLSCFLRAGLGLRACTCFLARRSRVAWRTENSGNTLAVSSAADAEAKYSARARLSGRGTAGGVQMAAAAARERLKSPRATKVAPHDFISPTPTTLIERCSWHGFTAKQQRKHLRASHFVFLGAQAFSQCVVDAQRPCAAEVEPHIVYPANGRGGQTVGAAGAAERAWKWCISRPAGLRVQ